MAGQSDPPKANRFKPGQSGNPAGRRAGSRSKVLVALDALGEGEAENIVKAMVEKAKGGDSVAGRTFWSEFGRHGKGQVSSLSCPRCARLRSCRALSLT